MSQILEGLLNPIVLVRQPIHFLLRAGQIAGAAHHFQFPGHFTQGQRAKGRAAINCGVSSQYVAINSPRRSAPTSFASFSNVA